MNSAHGEIKSGLDEVVDHVSRQRQLGKRRFSDCYPSALPMAVVVTCSGLPGVFLMWCAAVATCPQVPRRVAPVDMHLERDEAGHYATNHRAADTSQLGARERRLHVPRANSPRRYADRDTSHASHSRTPRWAHD